MNKRQRKKQRLWRRHKDGTTSPSRRLYWIASARRERQLRRKGRSTHEVEVARELLRMDRIGVAAYAAELFAGN